MKVLESWLLAAAILVVSGCASHSGSLRPTRDTLVPQEAATDVVTGHSDTFPPQPVELHSGNAAATEPPVDQVTAVSAETPAIPASRQASDSPSSGEWSEAERDAAALYGDAAIRDPWEGHNRRIHRFNNVVDRYVFRPLAVGYKRAVPDPIQAGVSRFFSNLGVPGTAVNQILQGRPIRALQSLGRFAVNTTLGIGGVMDPATRLGIPSREEDFGQTLATWGWRDSRYLVMPFFGPGSVRDTVGMLGDKPLSPIDHVEDSGAAYALQSMQIIDMRTRLLRLDQERREAYDEYALVRDAWAQHRRHEIDQDLRRDGD